MLVEEAGIEPTQRELPFWHLPPATARSESNRLLSILLSHGVTNRFRPGTSRFTVWRAEPLHYGHHVLR